MAFEDFAGKLAEYFFEPRESGYDLHKTLTLALILMAAVYALYRILRRLGIKVDKRLAVAVAPYVVLGAAVRVLEDAAVLPDSFLFVTPMIYVLVFCATFGVLLLSLLAERRFGVPYFKPMFLTGVFALPFALSRLPLATPHAAAVVVAFLLPWILAFRIVRWSGQNKIIALLHMLDATTTSVAIQFFGYYEQHLLPAAVIAAFGPFSFVLLKLAAVVAILVAIDWVSTGDPGSKDFADYVKLVIGILGAATAARDLITLVAGV
ncbi:MAG: DUF63 family protein [Candidatus Aenigmatarchaeota archaeon]